MLRLSRPATATGLATASRHPSAADLPPLDDYNIRPTGGEPGRTYMYYTGPVTCPFGYGLTYTAFKTSNLQLDRTQLNANDTLHASVEVTNTGSIAGSDLVQLYVTTPDAPAALQRPIKRLEGFRQVFLGPGQTKTVTLSVSVPNLAFFDQTTNRNVVDDGLYGIQITGDVPRGRDRGPAPDRLDEGRGVVRLRQRRQQQPVPGRNAIHVLQQPPVDCVGEPR